MNLDEVINDMNSVKRRIREHVEKPNLRPELPHGLPAYITVEAVTWVLDTLKSLKVVFSNARPNYKQAFRSLSILTLIVEHFEPSRTISHAILFAICSTVDAYHTGDREEANKYIFHLLHSEDSTLSGSGSVSALFKLNMAGNTANLTVTLTAQDLQLLQEWQRQYCGGIRQRSVRDINKCDAGTLPSFASAEETNPAEVAWNSTRFEGEQAEEENQPLVGVEVDSSTPALFKKGEFLAVKPGFEINACYSRILKSTNKRNPTAFAIAEVIESELEDDYLGLEQFLDSESDGVDGGHEENTVLHPPEGKFEAVEKGVEEAKL